MAIENEVSNENKYGNIWFKSFTLLVLAVIVIVALLREKIIDNSKNTVTVTGHGKISYQPNTATINLGAEVVKASTSEQALNDLNQKVNQIIAAVISQGIKREDISTQNYSLNPHYDYTDGKSAVSGYDANQQVIVKVKDVGTNQQKVSDILTAAGNAGANNIRNVSYDTADVNDLMQQAKIAAISDARQKSDALAQAAGIKLGKVIGWDQHSGQGGGYVPMQVDSLSAGAADKAIAPADLPSGTKDLEVDMDVKFEIK